ncbi:MAG: radical SAM protein, partial [Agathobacter sp.]|nr:radical SAM protein [Agathobacter sp.]
TRPLVPSAFDKMVEFAKLCRDAIKEVKWSIVDVLPENQIEECKQLSEDTGIPLRIRHFS